MGLLSGLGNLGLGKLEKLSIFGDKEQEEIQEEENTIKKVEEKDYLFYKTYTCPVCDYQFKEKSVRANKARLERTDPDLRQKFQGIDVLKYDAVYCTRCGFASLTKFFKGLSQTQIRLIRENISKDYKPFNQFPSSNIITYEEALFRYKICLANAIVKNSKESEKAYICLRAGWLLRGMQENLGSSREEDMKKVEQLRQQEDEFLRHAYDGFILARTKEGFPVCGMEENTMDYLLAMLAMRFDEDDMASRLISGILISPTANARIKNKARDVKDELINRRKARKFNES